MGKLASYHRSVLTYQNENGSFLVVTKTRKGKVKMSSTKHFKRRDFFGYIGISFAGYIIAFLLQACSVGPTDKNLKFGWVVGTVTDSLSSVPIDSAIIALADTLIAGDTTYTDTTGYYRAFAGSQGLYRSVFCRKTGYQSQKKIVDLTKETTRVDFKLSP